MEKETKEIVALVIAGAFVILFVTSVIVYLIPHEDRTEIDGKIIKVVKEGNHFVVTFDTGKGVIDRKISKYSFEIINGYHERMIIELHGLTNTPLFKWDGVYTIDEVTKLDNYAG